MKKILFSANFLKICTKNIIIWCHINIYINLLTEQPTDDYAYKLLLHKVYNKQEPPKNWIHLNFNQVCTSRQTHFIVNGPHKFKIGNNVLSKGLKILIVKIPLKWLNLSLESYKVKCNRFLLTFWFIRRDDSSDGSAVDFGLRDPMFEPCWFLWDSELSWSHIVCFYTW